MSGNNETIETLVVSKKEYNKCIAKVMDKNTKRGKKQENPMGAMMFSMLGMITSVEVWDALTDNNKEIETVIVTEDKWDEAIKNVVEKNMTDENGQSDPKRGMMVSFVCAIFSTDMWLMLTGKEEEEAQEND